MADIPLDSLLRCAIQVVGRIAIRPEQVGEILVVNATAKQFKAYNLCDGTKTQGEVTKAAGLDSGNFSRTVARWVKSGVLFRLGSGKEAKLLHIYPLAESDFKLMRKRKAGVNRKGRAGRKGARKRQRG